MSDLPLHRFFEFLALNEEEVALLDRLPGPPFPVEKRQVLRSEGDPVHELFFLTEGWVVSSVRAGSEASQIVKVHLPGDFMGSPSMVLTHAAETLTAVTRVRARSIPLTKVGEILLKVPRLAASMLLIAQQERLFLMDRMTSVGRRSSLQSLAAFLLHIHHRLRLVGVAMTEGFDLPLSQNHLADALGLTAVHVNRIFRELDDTMMIRREGRRVTIIDVKALSDLAGLPDREFARWPDWLADACRAVA